MIIAQRLYQLQEIEVEIESAQKTLSACLGKLGESDRLIAARAKLISIQKKLEELKKKQRETEWAIDDGSAKLHKANDDLYSGRIKNPKELTCLQQETKVMEFQQGQLEEKVLETMAQVDTVVAEQATQAVYLQATETEWRSEQAELAVEIQQLKNKISELNNKRQLMAAEIESQALDFYLQLKAKKGLAVAKIEQGMCRGCRISLSTSELQRVRVGHMVECSSCHRILYLP
jgi:predicted  nucleic acid-binding Zn-ribbon protein